MKNYGKIELAKGEVRNFWISADRYTGDTIRVSKKPESHNEWETIGYVTVENSYFPQNYFEIFENDIYKYLEEKGIIEKDSEDIYRFK